MNVLLSVTLSNHSSESAIDLKKTMKEKLKTWKNKNLKRD